MSPLLRWIWFLVLIAAFGAGSVALLNRLSGEHRPLWVGPLALLFGTVGVWLLSECERRGWVTGIFWSRSPELENRKRALAAERERMVAKMSAKLRSR